MPMAPGTQISGGDWNTQANRIAPLIFAIPNGESVSVYSRLNYNYPLRRALVELVSMSAGNCKVLAVSGVEDGPASADFYNSIMRNEGEQRLVDDLSVCNLISLYADGGDAVVTVTLELATMQATYFGK